MDITFDPALPIYTQIVEGFKREICSGGLKPGERVMPVRELALKIGVNPNTLQRALSELEREGLLYTERTAGRFVTQDASRIAEVREELLSGIVADVLRKATALGCPPEALADLIRNGGNLSE